MRHFASPNFWACYRRLPKQIQHLADTSYELLKADPSHPSLHFKKIGKYRAVRVGLHYRALAIEVPEGLLWFWIGSPPEYEEKGKSVIVRWGLKEAQSKSAGRRTGTGYEVWYARDEFQSSHRGWVEEYLLVERHARDSRWSESIAVGNKGFVAMVK